MKPTKLRRIHVVIIGAVACAIVAAGLYFLLIKKSQEKLAEATAMHEKYRPTGTQLNVTNAEKDRDLARKQVAEAQNSLDRYMKSKMPNLDLSDRAHGMIALWHEQSEVLKPLLVKWMSKSGVKVESDINIPPPPFNPNDAQLDAPVMKISVGKVKVKGTFPAIMKHIEKWNQCGRLVNVGPPVLTGNSPDLSCEYDLTVYIIPKEKAGPPLAIAGGTTGTPGT